MPHRSHYPDNERGTSPMISKSIPAVGLFVSYIDRERIIVPQGKIWSENTRSSWRLFWYGQSASPCSLKVLVACAISRKRLSYAASRSV
jgi:hypothetical protein